MEKYDSSEDTKKHIRRVGQLITSLVKELEDRASTHDKSKLQEPEKQIFDEFTPKLKGSTYGSEEYQSFLTEMKVALDHHYSENSHHPEHYTNGIEDMDLIDLLEMICDWKAATERHDDGNIYKSLQINKDRFKMSDQLVKILTNTVNRYIVDGKNG